MKTSVKIPVVEKLLTTKRGKKRLASSQPKCAMKKRLAKDKQTLDVESICTYHLVQITLGRVEKLLKELSSKPSGRIGAVKTTVTNPVNKNAKEGVNIVAKTPSSSVPSPRIRSKCLDHAQTTCYKTPLGGRRARGSTGIRR